MEYSYDENKLNDYFKKLNAIREESDIIYFSSESELVLKNLDAFALTWTGAINRPVINGTEIGKGFLVAMRDYKTGAKDIFELTKKTQDSWERLKK